MKSTKRVQFAHGLESSPQGSKARLLDANFDARTPAMNTRDFESCIAVHAAVLLQFKPQLLVGSSFGGAVVAALLDRGLWTGPTLLLAQAARHYNPSMRLPENVRVTLVHAPADDIVKFEDSVALSKTGTPGLVELIEVDDDHPLTKFVESGAFVKLVDHLIRDND